MVLKMIVPDFPVVSPTQTCSEDDLGHPDLKSEILNIFIIYNQKSYGVGGNREDSRTRLGLCIVRWNNDGEA